MTPAAPSTTVDEAGTGAPPADGEGAPKAKLASQIAQGIEAEVMRRGWPLGESLGSEPELQERYAVSRSVLREAVRLVEHHRVARMRRGPNGGLFICAPDAGPATEAVVIYLEHVGTSVGDLLHARQLLEPLAASLAAERITEEGIAVLRQALATELELDAEPGIRSQDSFHVVLADLSGNPVLRLFVDVLTRLTTRFAHTSRNTAKAEIRTSKDVSRHAHGRIVDAVISGDAGRAHARLSRHLDAVSQWLETHRARRPSPVAFTQVSTGPRAKMAEVVAARIREDIAGVGWQVGAVVGSEADLLARYGVSRAVLREAVRLLEHHSVARMRRGPGGGLVVARPEAQASIDAMALYLHFQRVTGEDLQVVRDAIELGTVARVAARRDDPETAERLQAAALWATEGPAGEQSKGDLFHTELAELAGNPLLSLFLRILTEVWRRHITEQPVPGPESLREMERVHDRILEALLDGDEGLAQHRMRRHLRALTPWWH